MPHPGGNEVLLRRRPRLGSNYGKASDEVIYEMNHTGIQVSDLSASLDFYQRVLGGEIVWSTEIAEIELDIVYLEIGGALVELLHSRRPRPDARFGIDHIAFLSDDLDADFAALVAAGHEPLLEPRPAGSGVGRNSFIADPNGNRVEILQRDLELHGEARKDAVVKAVDHVCVWAGDLDGAREFYHRLLGLEVLHEIDVPGSTTAISYLALGSGVLELLSTTDKSEGSFPHITLRVSDVEAAAKQLEERGAQVRRLPRPDDGDFARAADLVDPDGVRIELLDRPSLGDSFRAR